jgi:hypothetical protein
VREVQVWNPGASGETNVREYGLSGSVYLNLLAIASSATAPSVLKPASGDASGMTLRTQLWLILGILGLVIIGLAGGGAYQAVRLARIAETVL